MHMSQLVLNDVLQGLKSKLTQGDRMIESENGQVKLTLKLIWPIQNDAKILKYD